MFVIIISCIILDGCDDDMNYADDPIGNFDALVEIIDSRYCFLDDKHIDWHKIATEYRKQISPEISDLELFNICAAMLDRLQDGHVNLTSSFSTSYYRGWWSNYPQNFNLRTLQQYYLDFDYYSTSGMSYKILDGNIGYFYFPSFATGVSELGLDYVLAILYNTEGLIIDIRNNGGGLLTNIDTFVGRFIDKEIPGGSIQYKRGPGHDDFSIPYSFTFKPASEDRVKYLDKPICVLTNRACYSAANAFAAVMKSLDNVKIVGATTGGGGGLPFSSELPNGWSIRFSASPLYGPDGEITEFGVTPSEGFACEAPDEELAVGKDAILERAISFLSNDASSTPELDRLNP